MAPKPPHTGPRGIWANGTFTWIFEFQNIPDFKSAGQILRCNLTLIIIILTVCHLDSYREGNRPILGAMSGHVSGRFVVSVFVFVVWLLYLRCVSFVFFVSIVSFCVSLFVPPPVCVVASFVSFCYLCFPLFFCFCCFSFVLFVCCCWFFFHLLPCIDFLVSFSFLDVLFVLSLVFLFSVFSHCCFVFLLFVFVFLLFICFCLMFLSFFFHLFLTESASHPLSRQAAGVARLRSGDICRKCGALSPSEHVSAVAQWLACWAHNPKVRGSKPRCAIWCIVQCVRFWSPYGCVICRSCGAVCCGCVFRRGVLRFRVKCKLRQERIELPTLGL